MRKIISIVLSVGLLFQQGGLVYAAGEINLASYLSQAGNAIVQPDIFQPARLRYISYDIAKNDFKLLLDKGNVKLNDATPELFNYFLIGLALPNDTFWVNLRPDAPENIIDPLLEKTDIGKIFLEADLQLKKDTASLTSPQNPEGKLYWDKLYKKAGELFGTENITIPTITRPWIVPNEVIVRETEDSAYIYKATLKVLLEQDHLKDSVTYNFSDPRLKELNEYSSQIIRETIIPKLTKEVNSSKRYAQLRQVYYSLVLSRWFKQKYSSPGSAGASANSYLGLIDSGNLDKLASKESYDKQTYFQAYQKSFKDGEYNLKETVPTPFGQSIRSYISGGVRTKMNISIVGSPVRGDVTNALKMGLVGDLSLISTASPLEVKQAVKALKQIQSDLKVINTIVSGLSKNGYAYDINFQNISNPLGQVISFLQKKINYLGQMRTERISIEDISYFSKLKNDLDGIQSAINKFVEISSGENNSRNINDSIKNRFKNLSEGIVEVLKQAEKLNKESQGFAGSPIGVALPGVNGENGEPLRYISTEDLIKIKGGKLESLRSAVAQMTFSADEASKVDNRRFAVEIDPQGKITVWGILIYNEETQAVSRIILPNGLSDLKLTEEKNKNLSDALIQAWKEEVRINTTYAGSPVVGKTITADDENSKKIELRYVKLGDLEPYQQKILKGMIKNGLLFPVTDTRRAVVFLFTNNLDYIDKMRFAIIINGRDIDIKIKGILYNKGAEIEVMGDSESIEKALNKAWKEEMSASPAQTQEIVSSALEKQVGGIDLTDRALHIKLERVGSFASTPLLLPQVKNVQDLDLDKEFEQVEALASSGIVPNSHRLLELFTVCHYRGEFGERLNQIISCLKAASAIQEVQAIDTDEDFRLALMMPEVLS